MSAKEQTDLPKPRKPGPGSAAARAAERARLAHAATQMRATATETAATALTALLDLAQDRSGAAHLHGMASVIAREVSQRARNIDREVAHLIAGLDGQRTSKAG
jgi:hypothetical protein